MNLFLSWVAILFLVVSVSADNGARFETDGINSGEWKESNIIGHNFHRIRTETGKLPNLTITNVYGVKEGNLARIALQLNRDADNSFLSAGFCTDTDSDGKVDWHISADMNNSEMILLDVANSNRREVLNGSRFALWGNWIEFEIPLKYFPLDRKFIAWIKISNGGNELFQKQGAVFPSEGEEPVQELFRSSRPFHIAGRKPGTGSVDVLILADGYDASEKEGFIALAREYCDNFLANLTIAPFAADFSFSCLFIPSPASGFYDERNGDPANTLFRAGWRKGGYFDFDEARVLSAMCNVENADIVWIIGNKTRDNSAIGGTREGLGAYCLFSADVRDPSHETGHGMFGLGDEYEHEGWGDIPLTRDNFSYWPNVTVRDEWDMSTPESFRKSLKWGWIFDYPELAGMAGIIEGGWYHSKGVYRSMETCVMREGDPWGNRFCVVCADRIASVMCYMTGKRYNRRKFITNPAIYNVMDRAVMKYGSAFHDFTIIEAGAWLHGNRPEYVFDATHETLYTMNPLPARLVLDMGRVMNIGAVSWTLAASEKNGWKYRFSIEASVDGKTYFMVYRSDGTAVYPEGPQFLELNRRARYFRFTGADSYPWHELLISDFRVFSRDSKNPRLLTYDELLRQK